MRKSLWSPDEDEKLRQYVAKHGCGNWSDVAKHTGLHRCGKSCRLRWINYLRPDLKRGPFTAHEVRLVVNLHNKLGNSWSKIATHLPGRTDNDVKNFWHSYTRSRRLAVQQRQQMNIIGPQDDDDDDDDEKLCYSDVYGSNKNKEDKEHGHGAHHELQHPSVMFPLNMTNINTEVGNCKVPSLNEINAPPFHFNNTSSKTSTDRSNQVPPYPRALRPSLQEVKDNVVDVAPINTIAPKPVMIHDRFAIDAKCVIYKGVQSNNQISRPSKLGSYASGFYPSTSSVEASTTRTVSSTSHFHDSTKSSGTRALTSAADDWSLIFSPSTHVNDVINLQVLAEDAPESSLNEANCNIGGNSKPPEGLQSVIWRFFNQQADADPASSIPTSLQQLNNQRAQTVHQCVPHHHHHHHQKPYTSIAISSSALSAESSMQPPIQQLPTANQLMNDVEEAFSTYASLQYLQAQILAADCFS